MSREPDKESCIVDTGPREDGGLCIYVAAKACETRFDQLLTVLSEAGIKHYDTGRQIHTSFERWAGFLGVFAAENVSLDKRLESSPQMRSIFIQLLAVVERNATHGK
jgi:hypothetical protein